MSAVAELQKAVDALHPDDRSVTINMDLWNRLLIETNNVGAAFGDLGFQSANRYIYINVTKWAPKLRRKINGRS